MHPLIIEASIAPLFDDGHIDVSMFREWFDWSVLNDISMTGSSTIDL